MIPQSYCELNDLNWCCFSPLLECMAAPSHVPTLALPWLGCQPSSWSELANSPTTGGFTCQGFFSERQDYKVLAACILRTDQVVFYYQNNYISSIFLKEMSVIRYLIQKMRTVPQNVPWNQIWWGFGAFTVTPVS